MRDAPQEIFDGRFYRVSRLGPAVVRIARTAEPLSLDGARAELAVIGTQLAGVDRARTGLLDDLRDAPLRNDPSFETKAVQLRPALVLGFRYVAVLVRTAVGRLQINRLTEPDEFPTLAFLDEAEAVAHLHAILGGAPRFQKR